jgi:hypothetical protein
MPFVPMSADPQRNAVIRRNLVELSPVAIRAVEKLVEPTGHF